MGYLAPLVAGFARRRVCLWRRQLFLVCWFFRFLSLAISHHVCDVYWCHFYGISFYFLMRSNFYFIVGFVIWVEKNLWMVFFCSCTVYKSIMFLSRIYKLQCCNFFNFVFPVKGASMPCLALKKTTVSSLILTMSLLNMMYLVDD